MILDTEFLAALDDQNSAALQVAREIERSRATARIPTTVVLEWFVSVGKGSDPIKNQRSFKRLVGSKPVVALNDNIARRAGILEGTHQASDTKPNLGVVDATVAATGLAYNEPVVSTDTDFRHVDGLQVETI